MKEKDLQKQVLEFLRANNVFFYHPRETKKGSDGIPDVIACVGGKFVAIELKSPEVKNPSKKLRPEQVRIIDRIRDSGGFVLVSNDLEEIVKFINFVKHL